MAGYFVTGPITEEMSNSLQQALWRAAEQKEQTFTLIINSDGGKMRATLDILRTLDLMPPTMRIHTMCPSRAGSMATYLLAAGSGGHRYVGPEATLLVHHIYAENIGGSPAQLRSIADNLDDTQRKLNERYARLSRGKKSSDEWARMLRDYNDHILTAEEALEWGLADHIAEVGAD